MVLNFFFFLFFFFLVGNDSCACVCAVIVFLSACICLINHKQCSCCCRIMYNDINVWLLTLPKHSGRMIKSFHFVNKSLRLFSANLSGMIFCYVLLGSLPSTGTALFLQKQFLNSKHYEARCWHVIPFCLSMVKFLDCSSKNTCLFGLGRLYCY